MRKLSTKDWFGGGLVLAAVVMFAAPWLLGFAGATAPAASAWAIALAAFLMFIAVALDWFDGASAGAMTIGAWSLIAPFVLGFHGNAPALWLHLAAGAVIVALAVLACDGNRRRFEPRM